MINQEIAEVKTIKRSIQQTIEHGHIHIQCKCENCNWTTPLTDEPTTLQSEERFYVVSKHFDMAQGHADKCDHTVTVECHTSDNQIHKGQFKKRSLWKRLFKHSNRKPRTWFQYTEFVYRFATPTVFVVEAMDGLSFIDTFLFANLLICVTTTYRSIKEAYAENRMREIYERKSAKSGGVVW